MLDEHGRVAGTAGRMRGFGRKLAEKARGHTPIGAKAEKAFVDRIKAELRKGSSDDESYSYGGVKRLLQHAHHAGRSPNCAVPSRCIFFCAQRVPEHLSENLGEVHLTSGWVPRRHRERVRLKPKPAALPPPDDASVNDASVSTLGSNATLSSTITGATTRRRRRRRRRDEPVLLETTSLASLPELKGLPRTYKPPKVSLPELQRIKAINSITRNKAVARRMWYEQAMLDGDHESFARFLPTHLQGHF